MQDFKPVELWFRNPIPEIEAISKVPMHSYRFIMSRRWCRSRSIDPVRLMNHYFGGRKWELLLTHEKGAEYHTSLGGKPGHFPIWDYRFHDRGNMRLLFSYERRFIVRPPNTPRNHAPEYLEFVQAYRDFQGAFPGAKPHITGCFGYGRVFGLDPYSTDVDIRELPSRGGVTLPNGRVVNTATADRNDMAYRYWYSLLGYGTMRDFHDYENRRDLQIKSAIWASRHWGEIHAKPHGKRKRVTLPPESVGPRPVEIDPKMLASFKSSHLVAAPDSEVAITPGKGFDPEASMKRLMKRKGLPGDKIVCDTCSLASACREYRKGAVCAVPNTDGKRLADNFGTRDSSSILVGLQELMKINAERISQAVEAENVEENGLDPELSKLINQTFSSGEKLAKLYDPTLRPGPAAQVLIQNSQNGSQPALSATPQQLTATVVREIEKQGVPREQITPQMVTNFISAQATMTEKGEFTDTRPYEGEETEEGVVKGEIV